MSLITRLREWLNISKNCKYRGIPKNLPDHIYRDIGMSEGDVEQLRHIYPSQSRDAPKF